jgi:hypothetical protein
VAIDFGIQNTVTLQEPNLLILNDGTEWGDWGFAVGMTVDFIYTYYDVNNQTSTPPQGLFAVDILNIYGDTLELAYQGTTQPIASLYYSYGQIAPIRGSDYEIRDVRIQTFVGMEGIRLDYAHLKNSQSPSGTLNNVIDGTKTAFVAEDVNLMTVGGTIKEFDHYLTPYQSGLSIDRVNLTYVTTMGTKTFFNIDVMFMLSSFGDLLNFQNLIAPDELVGAESITDQILVTGYPVYNNPNVQITNDVRKYAQEGNCGWFNENYNQLPNLFSLTPAVYQNASGTVVGGLDYANPITVSTTISGVNVVPGQTRVMYGFIWNPLEEDYYKRREYPFHECRKVSTGGTGYGLNDWFTVTAVPVVYSPFPAVRDGYTITGSGTVEDDAKMDASDISFVQNGTDIDVSITFRPNSAFFSLIDGLGENERGYALWISVGDQVPNANQSDRVSLLLDVNVMTTFIEPIGPYEGMTIDFLDHPQDYTDTPRPCGNSIFVEDDLLAKISFTEETDFSIPNTPELTKITYGFLVQNTTTEEQYILDASDIDMTQYPDPTQYNFDQSRGFKLGAGNTKNWFKLDYDNTTTVGTREGVLGWYGYKIRWEDWIKRFPTPPNDFYDNTEAQNGLNNDWYHYFSTSGWNFYFYVNLTAILNGATVVYQNLKEIAIRDYEDNADISTEIKTYLDNNGVKGAQLVGGTDPISGLPLNVIIKNDYVWLEIIYTSNIGAIADWANQVTLDANAYGVDCIEVDGGAGQKQFRQISSVWLPEFDNPLEALPANTLASLVYVSSTEVRVECRINGNKLIDASRYKISGRIGCK